MPDLLVIGIGNQLRGDDGIGPALARRLSERALPDVSIKLEGGEALSLLAAWEGHDDVLLIDAAQTGAAPGTIHCFDAHCDGIPKERFGASSHGFGVSQAVALARTLGRLPGRCRIIAIEGEAFGHGTSLSPRLTAATDTLVDEITAMIVQPPAPATACRPAPAA